ncbi:cytochrome c oxidase subunit II [Stackebrandtia soli]|uniref:aa3-type cytochrome oxidase subunit II n=1 Tax=Stackebrandtia soli TaxID=1892856 RepID=UPI0039E92BDE
MLVPLLAGCTVSDAFAFGWPQRLPTPQSEQMFNMWIGSAIAALAVGVFVWGLIFWCVIRYRKKSDELPVQTRYNLPIEMLFTVTPFVVIAVLFYFTAVIQTDVNKISENPDREITLTAFKWNWEFSYPETDPDGDGPGRPVATVGNSDYIPVLVVPTDETILFTEVSNDVIHSFWVPDLLFKRDVMPGFNNQFEVTITQEGAYVGRCAELCGAYHSMMNFELRAVSSEDYDEFLAHRVDGMSTPEALEAIGQEPFATTTKPFDTKPNSGKAS